MYPQKMASNQLNPMSWIVGVLLLCSFLVGRCETLGLLGDCL